MCARLCWWCGSEKWGMGTLSNEGLVKWSQTPPAMYLINITCGVQEHVKGHDSSK